MDSISENESDLRSLVDDILKPLLTLSDTVPGIRDMLMAQNGIQHALALVTALRKATPGSAEVSNIASLFHMLDVMLTPACHCACQVSTGITRKHILPAITAAMKLIASIVKDSAEACNAFMACDGLPVLRSLAASICDMDVGVFTVLSQLVRKNPH